VALHLPEALEVLLRSLHCPLNACIDVVTLLEVYILKEVAADRFGGIELPYISIPCT